jgi:hypothetical protein
VRHRRKKAVLSSAGAALVALILAAPTSAAQQSGALDSGLSRAVYRLAELRRARDLDAAIVLYRRYVALEPGDAWGHLALGNALAARGDVRSALAAYDAALRLAPREREMQVARSRMLTRTAGWIEPALSGTRDSDGITTWRTGVNVTSPDRGRGRLFVSIAGGAANDALASRGSLDTRVGTMLRPAAVLRLELSAGAHRVDRSFIDTTQSGLAPGPGAGPGGPGGIGRRPAPGRSITEMIPVGRIRMLWTPGPLRIDARASRQVLDASPYLVAQGVRRDELGAELDLRVAGPLRLRAFGRTGTVGNEMESNERRLVGGALAIAPRAVDVSIRAQELSYGGTTSLAYFAPRYVRTFELTTYLERELGDVQLAVDAGGGVQQVAAWSEPPARWSPTARAWLQLAKPLTPRVSLGAESEMYDSRVGTDMPAFEVPAGRWRYGSLRVWLRAVL